MGMDLDAVAEHLGVEVTYGCPEVGHWGDYDALAHRITLLPRLGAAQHRSTYSHELGHSLYRHERSTARAEREASHAAHWLTIPLCDFLRAVQENDSMQAVAHDLGVMPSDVKAYARRFEVHHGC